MTPPRVPSHGTGAHRPHRRGSRRWAALLAALATGAVLATGVTALAAGGGHAGTARLGVLTAAGTPGRLPAPATPARAVQPAPGSTSGSSPTDPSPTARRANRSTPRPAPSATTLGPEARVLLLVNQERAKAGCRALRANTRLATAARAHSTDMATRGYFDHVTPDGVDPGQRITQAGYAWSAYGENIAMGQPDADAVMLAWMNSSGHRANILNCGFHDLGVGLAYDAGHRPYWTQDFGTPR